LDVKRGGKKKVGDAWKTLKGLSLKNHIYDRGGGKTCEGKGGSKKTRIQGNMYVGPRGQKTVNFRHEKKPNTTFRAKGKEGGDEKELRSMSIRFRHGGYAELEKQVFTAEGIPI